MTRTVRLLCSAVDRIRSTRDERGAYAILMSMVLVLVIAMAAISIDIAKQVESKQRLHDTLDAAAHAAVIALGPGPGGVAQARNEAIRVARVSDPTANPQVSMWCVVASTGEDEEPNVGQIPRTCEPDSVRKGPYNELRYPGLTCDAQYCFFPCSETNGNCNTVRVADNRDVDYDFAPAIGFDRGSTGAVVTVACKGTCGTGQPKPIDLVVMADRTYSMYMFNNSHSALNDMINGIKTSLLVMDPTMHHVALGTIHKSLGDTHNGRCLTTAVPDPAVPSPRPANWPVPDQPTKTAGESNSAYATRMTQWRLQQGTWVPVPFSNDYKAGDALNPNSALVKSLDCLVPRGGGNAQSFYSPANYRTHLASALKGAGRYLLGRDANNSSLLPTDRPGQRDKDGNLIPDAVMKVIIFETDGEPREPLNAPYTGLNSPNDIGAGGESNAQKKQGCDNLKRIAGEIKDEDVTIIMIGFGDANTITCGSNTYPVRDALAGSASNHPQTGDPSAAERCNNQASVDRENSDGDYYYCAADGDDLAAVFQTALANLSSGVRLLKQPG